MRIEDLYTGARAFATSRAQPWFDGDYDLNAWAFRMMPGQVDAFCDFFALFFLKNGAPCVRVFPCATRPGSTHLVKPLPGLAGTFILAAGHHPKLWIPGRHRGAYPAMVQRPGAIARGYRDGDMDSSWDYVNPVDGEFGINLHHAHGSSRVGAYSAGCVVLRHPADLDEVLSHVRMQESAGHGNALSLTLVHVGL